MTSFTRWEIAAAAITAICGLAFGLGIAATPQKPAKDPPTVPTKPPVAEVKRDRFNDPLPPRAIARMGTVALRHRGGCWQLAYALDGKRLVSIGGFVRIWDAESGRELNVLGGLDSVTDEHINAADVSADGKTAFVNAYRINPNKSMEFHHYYWDIDAGKEVRTFSAKPPDSAGGSRGPHLFAPNGSAMAEVAHHQGEIWLWDGRGQNTHTLKVSIPRLTGFDELARFTPDGRSLVTCDDTQTVKVWNVATGQLARSFGGNLPAPSAIVVSPDGR